MIVTGTAIRLKGYNDFESHTPPAACEELYFGLVVKEVNQNREERANSEAAKNCLIPSYFLFGSLPSDKWPCEDLV